MVDLLTRVDELNWREGDRELYVCHEFTGISLGSVMLNQFPQPSDMIHSMP